ncbi:glycosyltransferase [Candidatus Microgenomates bacterium]|nr:MAG: glycosyltransferase [Candidatus Microgenomates bacterium]
MSKSNPVVSIIIATKNEELNINRLLVSIRKQTYKNIEVIIVDNFSIDQTIKIAQRFNTRIIQQSRERSKQRNTGAVQAKGKYLLFLDADMELPQNIIGMCVKKCEHGKYAALIIPENTPLISWFAHIKNLEKSIYKNEDLIEAPRFITKTSFTSVGGYNENLIAGEDWDLAQKMRNHHVNIGRINSSLYHYETSLFRELKHKWYYTKSIHNYAQKYPRAFKKQSGLKRLEIFWRKRNLLFQHPLAATGLILVKSIEFCMYILK